MVASHKQPHLFGFTSLGAMALALALSISPSTAAAAQDAGGTIAPVPAMEDTAAGTAAGGDPIVVTGTRITSPILDSAYPITTVTQDVIVRSGHVNLTELLAETPALVSSITANRTAGSRAQPGQVGINLLDLRNLGTARTLALVNGRRHVSSVAGTAAVDINTIPAALVERVDVLTGGVSAIYGADGVSGVVNFVLKRDFEGIEARGQNGISSRGDAQEYYGSLTAGHIFGGGAGNIAVSYEYRKQARVDAGARRSGRAGDFYAFQQNPADFPIDDPNVPDRIPFNDLRVHGSSPLGAIDTNFDFAPEFLGNGAPFDPGRVLVRPGGLAQGGSGTQAAGYQGDLQPGVETHNANLLASYEFSPALRLFAEGKYVSTKARTEGQPLFDSGTILLADNPYLPTTVRSAIVPGLLGMVVGAPPEAGLGGVVAFRDHLEFGRRVDRSERETWRGVIGFDGELGGNMRYELAYTYGQTTSRIINGNRRIGDRYFAAIDAIDVGGGNIVCRSTVMPGFPNFNMRGPYSTFTPGAGSACVPLNILGDNVANQAALDFILTDLESRAKLTQHVISGSISGDTGGFLELPGGPVSFAIGGEYRKEKSRFTPDELLAQGMILDQARINAQSGAFDVSEVFAELRVPVLRDVPGAELLQFGAAIRLSDYSTVGSTTTWKVDGVYAPIRDVRLRATYSEAVRAPNIAELFAPASGVTGRIMDPCDIAFVNSGSSSRAGNCAAVLGALDIDPATYNPIGTPAGNVSIGGVNAGNLNLKEETARTWTAGVAFTPRFLPGLSASFDWYDIRLRNAINTPDAQEIVNLCVDQPSLDNPFCGNVTRSAQTGYITSFLVTPANVAQFRTAGADVTINYGFEPGANLGAVNLRLVAGYLDKLRFIATPGAAVTNERWQAYAPKWSGTFDLTWSSGPFTANYGVTYFSETLRFSRDELRANPDLVAPEYLHIDERWQHDLQLAADAYDGRATFYAGVQNLFDRQPDIGELNYPVSYRGRFFYFGIKARLGGR